MAELIENPTLQNIYSRKSVRKYTEQPVEKEKIATLLKAAMAAPSGKDMRPWEFIVVTDRTILDAMAEGLPFAKMLTQVSTAIIVCGDTKRSPYWYLDCSAATQNLLLAAESMGLGTVWTAAYPYEERMKVVRDNIESLPEEVYPLCVIPVGYPNGPQKIRDKYEESKIHYEQW